MTRTQPQFLSVGEQSRKRAIAYITQKPDGDDGANTREDGREDGRGKNDALGIIWLMGLKSDMTSTKATALSQWAPENGYHLTRFDYSGHGLSDGNLIDATIGDWLEESRDILLQATNGPQILVGSSTGGHLALLLLRDLLENSPGTADRIKALVLIAPAWDLTQDLMWNVFSTEQKREIMDNGFCDIPSDYGEPFRITRRFIEEGRDHLFKRQPFNPGRPVIILQGALDTSVPPQHSRDLIKFLQGDWGQLTEVKDGDHSLSRPQDLELLFNAINAGRGRFKQPTSL